MSTNNIFVKLVEHQYFMSLVKEARRVKYLVEGKCKDMYTVRDNSNNDLVFKGMYNGTCWITQFSKAYWQEQP